MRIQMRQLGVPALALWASLLVACGDAEESVRRYEEVVIAPASSPPPGMDSSGGPAPVVAAAETGSVELAWETPAGWEERPGSGMRLVTFRVGPNADPSECTITAFPGDVGGVRANLRRWAGQLGLSPSPAELEAFESDFTPFETAGGMAGKFFDFSSLVPGDDASQSMLAGMVPRGGMTVFVKLMGPRRLLAAEREAFLALCRSLR